jgi:probable rRNA maturation factor
LSVQYAVKPAGAPTRAQVRRWLAAALERDAEVAVRIVGAEEGQTLNHDYRHKNYATNVLTFCYDDPPSGAPLMGDLVLCAPVVEREAAEQGKSLEAHYCHLLVHGALHLRGFGHEADDEAECMEALETQIVTDLGYPAPYG